MRDDRWETTSTRDDQQKERLAREIAREIARET